MRALAIVMALVGVARADDAREIGRRYQEWFVAGDARLFALMNAGLQKINKSPEGLKKFATEQAQKNGRELRVVEELQQYAQEGMIYRRRAIFERAYLSFTWHIEASGRVVGVRIEELPPDELGGIEAPTKFADYLTKAKLRLPFDGAWKVAHGGRTLAENSHAGIRAQRFATDIVRDDCMGQPIRAPAAGLVVAAVDGFADGKRDLENIAGNHVHLDLGNGEYALLAHLQKGTVAVEKGARVEAGQLIGRCGNSGNSSQPHLHFHLENSPRPFEGEGLPAQFLGYSADGKSVARGEPRRGQVISVDATSRPR